MYDAISKIDPLLRYARHEFVSNPRLTNLVLGLDRIDSKEARDAFEECERLAAEGSPLAMCMCSRLCHNGFGTTRCDKAAFKWAMNASAAGFAPGYYELGLCYENGIGVPANLSLAVQCYEQALNGGFGLAGGQLAILYHSGKCGNEAKRKATQYAECAFRLGDALAAVYLATWYEHGDGVEKNEANALHWYVMASDLGDFNASFRLSMAYGLGQLGLEKDEQIAAKYLSMCSSQLSSAE